MIKLVNVSKFYSSNNVIALGLRKVNLELHRNEFVAIVGESGSGKTTLLNVISGIDSYEDGEMYINGKETSYFSVSDMENYRKKYVAFVFQSYNLIDSYTVLQNVEAPLILSGYPQDKIRSRAKEIIKRVGLEDHMHHKSTRLSGGQKQRVVIARALAKDCPIIAADEPTGNLDSESAKQIIELLHEISKEKLVIMVTHDFNQVKDYATRKIRIFDGEIVEDMDLQKVDKLNLPDIPDEKHEMKTLDYFAIALRNLLSVPKKTILMIFVFAFFSFFVAMAYGAYVTLSNATTFTDNYYFNNTNPNRIVVRNVDNSAFTQDQLDELADYGIVSAVLTFDYILDVNFSMETHADYSDRDYFYGGIYPLALIAEDDLKYGRMPQTDDEIVLSVNDGLIDAYEEDLPMTIYYDSSYISVSYKVVGLVSNSKLTLSTENIYSNYFFVSDEAMTSLQKTTYFQYMLNMTVVDDEGETYFDKNNATIIIDNNLDDFQILTSKEELSKICEEEVCTYDVSMTIEDYYDSRTIDDIELLVVDDGYFIYNSILLFMNEDTLDALTYEDIYQVSLLTDTDIGVQALLTELERGGLFAQYKAIYPYDSEPLSDDMGMILLLINLGLIAMVAVVIMGSTLITYVIFRAIINTKLHDYAIYRTIGANQGTIKAFIYVENLFIVLVAYAIFLAINLNIPSDITESSIFYVLKVYTFMNYMVFFLLMILMSLLISRKYSNRIFKNTVQTTLKTSME